jgi:hypothetical protein
MRLVNSVYVGQGCTDTVEYFEVGENLNFFSADCREAFQELTSHEPETGDTWVTYYPSVSETIDCAFKNLRRETSMMLKDLKESTLLKLSQEVHL